MATATACILIRMFKMLPQQTNFNQNKNKKKHQHQHIALDKIANVPIPFIRDGLSECIERTDILITLRLGLWWFSIILRSTLFHVCMASVLFFCVFLLLICCSAFSYDVAAERVCAKSRLSTLERAHTCIHTRTHACMNASKQA